MKIDKYLSRYKVKGSHRDHRSRLSVETLKIKALVIAIILTSPQLIGYEIQMRRKNLISYGIWMPLMAVLVYLEARYWPR
jgi:hypothetical protein